MNNEKTLAELAQGETGIATLRVNGNWQTGVVFESGGEAFFASFVTVADPNTDPHFHSHLTVCRFKILNNGVKVGSEVLAIPAAELKALLSELNN